MSWEWNAIPDEATQLNMECHEALYWLVSYAIALEYEDVCAAASSSESLTEINLSEASMNAVGADCADVMEEVLPEQNSEEDIEDDATLTAAVDHLAAMIGLNRHTQQVEDDAGKMRISTVAVQDSLCIYALSCIAPCFAC